MSFTPHEAAAQLAAYGFTAESTHRAYPSIYRAAYEFAGLVVLRDNLEPAQALDQIRTLSNASPLPFTDWEQDPSSKAAVELRVGLQEAFDDRFATAARRIDTSSWRNLWYGSRHRMGNGSNMVGYRAENSDGVSVIRKIAGPHLPASGAKMVESFLARLLPLRGIHSAEQLQGISYSGKIASSAIAGTPYDQLGMRGLRKITDDHLRQAVTDIDAISDRQVEIDCIGSGHNLFHPKTGFGFFDPLSAFTSPQLDLRETNMDDFHRMLRRGNLYKPTPNVPEKITTLRLEIANRLGKIMAEQTR